MAGLEPKNDFLLGSMDDRFRDINEFTQIVKSFTQMGKALHLLVYNNETNNIRLVILMPKLDDR